MRSSGLGWAPRIPSRWDVAKVCLIARLESGHTPSRKHPEYWVPDECSVPWFSLADVWQLREANQKYLGNTSEKISPRGLANSAARLLPAGTVVLSRTASVGFAGIMPRPMATTQDFANWICGPRVVPDYLLWAFRAMSGEFVRMRMGSTHQTIYMPDIRRLAIPLPPVPEQRAIADFLDRKTAAVDALIAKKKQLRALVRERLESQILSAVTRGLSGSGMLKDSGFTWVGAIPVNWTMKRLRYVARRVDVGIAEAATHAYAAQGVALLRSTNVTNGTFTADDLLFIEPWFAEKNRSKYLRAGDILSVRTGDAGRSVVVPQELDQSQCFTLLMTTLKPGHVPEYYCAYINSRVGVRYFDLESWGTAQKNISVPILASMPVPEPPLEEQLAIARHVLEQQGRAATLLNGIELQLAKLAEHRQALITAAVTGQLDIAAQPQEAA